MYTEKIFWVPCYTVLTVYLSVVISASFHMAVAWQVLAVYEESVSSYVLDLFASKWACCTGFPLVLQSPEKLKS